MQDERPEYRGHPSGRRRTARRFVPEPVLNHGDPHDRRDRQQERAPELVAEHLHRMFGVLVMRAVFVRSVTAVSTVHIVARMCSARVCVVRAGLVNRVAGLVVMRHHSTTTLPRSMFIPQTNVSSPAASGVNSIATG